MCGGESGRLISAELLDDVRPACTAAQSLPRATDAAAERGSRCGVRGGSKHAADSSRAHPGSQPPLRWSHRLSHMPTPGTLPVPERQRPIRVAECWLRAVGNRALTEVIG